MCEHDANSVILRGLLQARLQHRFVVLYEGQKQFGYSTSVRKPFQLHTRLSAVGLCTKLHGVTPNNIKCH
jgi:hypothetical protein